MSPREATLRRAAATYTEYDRGAIVQQKRFFGLFVATLIGAVVATLLATLSGRQIADGKPLSESPNFNLTPLGIATIAIPLVVAALSAYLAQVKPGTAWVLLRGAAEAIKREIVKYRAAVGPYAEGSDAESALVNAIGAIRQSTQQSAANAFSLEDSSLDPAPLSLFDGDDGLRSLTGDEYVVGRLWDQIAFYRKKCRDLDGIRRIIQCSVLVIGVIGSILAATNQAPWVALTTSIAAGLAAYAGAHQLEASIIKYNQTRADLETVADGWGALKPEQKSNRANFDLLVERGEATLERELSGWVQHMQEALKDFSKSETAQGPKDPKVDGDAATEQ